MHINSSAGNFFNKTGNTVPASNPSSGEQEKQPGGTGEVKSEATTSPQTVEIKPVDNQKSKISNQVANPAGEGVDVTI